MKNLMDILSQTDMLVMYPLIQAYLEKYTGIHVEQQTLTLHTESDDEPTERMLIFPYYNLKTKQHLDHGELTSILSAHFADLLFHNSVTFDELLDLKNQIHHLGTQLTSDFIDDHPEASVIKRFVDGYYFSIIQQLKQTTFEQLSNPHFEHTLLNPLDKYLDTLETLIPYYDFTDLIDAQLCLNNLMGTTEDNTDFTPKLEEISKKIVGKINHEMTYIYTSIATYHEKSPATAEQLDASNLTIIKEKLPTLKSQIYIRKNLPQFTADTSILAPLLDKTIKDSILDLLNSYENQVQASVTDFRKTQKLATIQKLKQMCIDNSDPDYLYQEIVQQGDLLKSQPIGRYLYECICWMLSIKVKPEKYSATLFHAIDAEKNEPSINSSHNRKLKGA